jgi:hypothetical protein
VQVDRALKLHTHFQQVLGSNFGPDTDYINVFYWCVPSHHRNAEMVPRSDQTDSLLAIHTDVGQ